VTTPRDVIATEPDDAGAEKSDLSSRLERVAAPLREQVLDVLRKEIVEMRLRPGQRLVERELIERIGVSRTTIREALRELAAEGLVTTIPQKGAIVAVPSWREAEEVYEVRALLEGAAAREFAERATDAHVAALRGALVAVEESEHDATELLNAKDAFYRVLFDGSGNRTIRQIIESLQARSRSSARRRCRRPTGRGSRSSRSARSSRRSSGATGKRPPRRRPTTSGRRRARSSARSGPRLLPQRSTSMPDEKRYEEGRRVRGEVLGEEHVERSLANASEFNRPIQELVTEYCWGVIWARPGLGRRERSLVNLGMLTALNRSHELAVHVRGALRNGCTPEEIQEVLLQAAIYCGVPAAMEAFRVAEAAIGASAPEPVEEEPVPMDGAV
jgi:4-carboxymuconolactone decarboxylase